MIEQILLKHLHPLSDFIYGFADMRGLLDKEYSDFSYAISIGRRLDDLIVDGVKSEPTMEYYRHYRSINTEMTAISERICKDLKDININCLGIFPTISSNSPDFEHYLKTLRYKHSHKMVATRAGLGWIGKTDLFVSFKFGPRLRLMSILINEPVQSKLPAILESRCGECEVCVRNCPVQAANGRLWNISTDRDLFFNAHKCREQCKNFGNKIIDKDGLVCGLCVAVCPQGKKKQMTNPIDMP